MNLDDTTEHSELHLAKRLRRSHLVAKGADQGYQALAVSICVLQFTVHDSTAM